MMFFRRKHQKIDETSDKLPQLRHSDLSSGSDSVNSFDPCSCTHDSAAQSPILTQLQRKNLVEYPSRFVANESKSRQFWKLGWTSQRMVSTARRRKKALEELDKTITQIRRNSSFAEAIPPRSILVKDGGTSDIDEASNIADSSKVLPREVTWKRRVSSLEAFFNKEYKSKYHFNGGNFDEPAIKKVVPFETRVGKSESSLRTHDEMVRTKHSRRKPTKRNSTFEESVEQGVSDIIGKITSRSEEILDSVPDWSVASSSVDFISAATSDDETSISGYRQIDSSWGPAQRSTSSGDDDEFFTPDKGCDSVESCATLSKEFEVFLEEMMPRDFSMFSCYAIRKRKHKRRRKKQM